MNAKIKNYFKQFTPQAIVSSILSISLIFIFVAVITYFLIAYGIGFGRYSLNQLFPSFNDAMSGRLTEFQRMLKEIQKISAIIAFTVGVPIFILTLILGKKKTVTTSEYTVPYFLCSLPLMGSFFLLLCFQCTTSICIFSIVVFYILAIILTIVCVLSSRSLGILSFFLMLSILLIGAFFVLLIVPFIGLFVQIFGNFSWLVLLLAASGSSTCGYISIHRHNSTIVIYR